MRSDRDLGLKKEDGELLHLTGQRVQGNPNTSLSGHERNHLFMNNRGKQFSEISSLSGIDHSGDSRAFAVLDFDRDGLLDIALVNANAPRFQLFRNRLDQQKSADQSGFISLRLIGGNRTSTPSSEWSALDAIGARVELMLGELTLTREHAAGRGLAAQNSSTLFIGIGASDRAESVSVSWPSGRVTELGDIQAGQLVTVHEDPSQSPNGVASESTSYLLNLKAPSQTITKALPTARFQPEVVAAKNTNPGLRVYTAMATWCASCKRELPQVQRINDVFKDEQVEFYGIGVDVKETPEQLEEYILNSKPAYELLAQLEDQTRVEFKEHIETALKSEALPCTVITSADGRVLKTMFAIPSVSELRSLLDQQASN